MHAWLIKIQGKQTSLIDETIFEISEIMAGGGLVEGCKSGYNSAGALEFVVPEAPEGTGLYPVMLGYNDAGALMAIS